MTRRCAALLAGALLVALGLPPRAVAEGLPTAAAPPGAGTPSETGRLLAGLRPDAYGQHPERRRVVKRHSREAQQSWERYLRTRGAPLARWAKAELPPFAGATVFYPFSGPDFPTAHRLFPAASRYLMVALQHGGRPPDLGALPAPRFEAVLRLFARGFRGFGWRGFFLTDHLTSQLRPGGLLGGVAAVLLAFAEREGYEVVAAVPIALRPDGQGVLVLPGFPFVAAPDSLRLVLRHRATGRAAILDYLRLDLSDAGLRRTPGARRFVEDAARHPVLLKAASHLLQSPGFSVLRRALLARAPFVLQDESGLAYHQLAAHFAVRLYGRFVRVNPTFRPHLQKSLARAHRLRTDVRPLGFPFGYGKPAGACIQVAHRRRQPPRR